MGKLKHFSMLMGLLCCFGTFANENGASRKSIEKQSRQLGIKQIFVLTTRTAHWFVERGFESAKLDKLPVERQKLYNYQRKSRVFIKDIT